MTLGRFSEREFTSLGERIPRLRDDDRLEAPVLLVVKRGDVKPAEVANALGLAERAGARVIGIALS